MQTIMCLFHLGLSIIEAAVDSATYIHVHKYSSVII